MPDFGDAAVLTFSFSCGKLLVLIVAARLIALPVSFFLGEVWGCRLDIGLPLVEFKFLVESCFELAPMLLDDF